MASLRIPAKTKRGKALFVTADPAAAAYARTDPNLIVVEAALPEEMRAFLERNYCRTRKPRERKATARAADPAQAADPAPPNAPKAPRARKAQPISKAAQKEQTPSES